MFIDFVKIFVKSGNGGDGRLSFHKEKYVQAGGPDGGNGGRGGDVIVVADPSMRTLLDFRFKKHFIAGDGEAGGSNLRTGARGQDVEIRVPQGTVIKDAETGKVVADMFDADSRAVILRGGSFGRGNASFKSASLHTPNFAQQGELTKQHQVILELKTIADVGLVGFPNVGKSTILSMISKARPKIANYHFTTLQPNLGVVQVDGFSFVVADIPGLIEGAADGAGLGHDFLRHIERTRVIAHVVDVSGSEGRDPVEDYEVINKELEQYSAILAQRPQIVIANKSELSNENLGRLREAAGERKVFETSAATNSGFMPVLRELAKMLKDLPAPEPIRDVEELVYIEDPDSFEIDVPAPRIFCLRGTLVDRLLRKINFSDSQSLDYFQRILREKGVIEQLREKGAKEGDTIRIEDLEFDFIE